MFLVVATLPTLPSILAVSLGKRGSFSSQEVTPDCGEILLTNSSGPKTLSSSFDTLTPGLLSDQTAQFPSMAVVLMWTNSPPPSPGAAGNGCGDIFGSHDSLCEGRGLTGIWWAEVRDAPEHPTIHRTVPTQNAIYSIVCTHPEMITHQILFFQKQLHQDISGKSPIK